MWKLEDWDLKRFVHVAEAQWLQRSLPYPGQLLVEENRAPTSSRTPNLNPGQEQSHSFCHSQGYLIPSPLQIDRAFLWKFKLICADV